MLISELQAQLEAIKQEHGDIPIVQHQEYGRHTEYAWASMYSARDFLKRMFKVKRGDNREPMIMGGMPYIEIRIGL